MLPSFCHSLPFPCLSMLRLVALTTMDGGPRLAPFLLKHPPFARRPPSPPLKPPGASNPASGFWFLVFFFWRRRLAFMGY